MTEDFRPYSFYEDGVVTGVGVEIVATIMDTLHITEDIKIYPWARAYKMIQSESNSLLFLMARTEEREELFQWVGPILSDRILFYKNSNSAISLSTVEDAKNVRQILVNRDYPQHTMLTGLGFDNLYVTVKPEQDVQMLRAKRADLMVIGELAFNELIKASKIPAGDIESTGVELFKTQLYIAFSKDVPLKTIKAWQSTLDNLKTTPTYSNILNKYGIVSSTN